MTCFHPAPDYYVLIMHNLHFISTPIYFTTLFTLIRETSPLFQKYKYFLIAHIIVNFLSEIYVTVMWLPVTHLPYDVYKTTGLLAQLNVSGIFQFMMLAQFIVFIGVSILEMFYHRFIVVVIHQSGSFHMKIPKYCINIFRFFTVIHLLAVLWITVNKQTLVYQQTKKDELFRKVPELPEDVRCYTVFILAPEDPVLVFCVAVWGVLVTLGSIVILSSVLFINKFLNKARNLSKETKKLQKMLILSLIVQAAIHGLMIIFPVFVQIYQMVFILYNNDFATVLLVCIAYHGFLSTCAMLLFTKQLRIRILQYTRKLWKPKTVLIRPNQVGNSTFVDSIHN